MSVLFLAFCVFPEMPISPPERVISALSPFLPCARFYCSLCQSVREGGRLRTRCLRLCPVLEECRRRVRHPARRHD